MGRQAATILAGSPALGPNSELVGDQCEDKRESQNYVTVVGYVCLHARTRATRTCTYTLEWQSVYIQVFTHKNKLLTKLCGVRW